MGAIDGNLLGCRLGGRSVFADLDVRIPRGSFVGVFGPNGAGKTTFLRCLLGLAPLSQGSLRILDRPSREARSLIGYVSQFEPGEAEGRLSASAFVSAAWRGEKFGFNAKPSAARTSALMALERVGAAALANRPLQQLSGGQRQRVRIAQALVNPAQILLLDEPLNNLDPAAQQQLLNMAKAFTRDQGMTVLMTAHGMDPLLPYMDQILYLANGKGRLGTLDDLLTTSMLSDLYGMPVTVRNYDGMLSIRVGDGFSPELTHHCHNHAGHS